MGISISLFLSGKLLYFFSGPVTIRTHFLKCFAVRAVGNALQPQIFLINQQLNLSQVSNKAASSADKEKLLKEYFHRGYLYEAIVSLLEKRHGVRMPVRMRKRKVKNRPRKVRPVRRCSLSTFTLITCRSFIILNFSYARNASQIQVRKLCKI